MARGQQPNRERSPRKARACQECHWRFFGDLDADCPVHGKAKTIDQPDNRYFGQVPLLREEPS